MNPLDGLRELIVKYRTFGILVDANMLLLKFVGDCDPSNIRAFKRTRQFTAEDYQALQMLLQPFERLVTTPHILTEVSNLAGQIDDQRRLALFETFSSGIAILSEEHLPSREVSATPQFRRLGLTDAAIARIAKDRLLVLTADLPRWVFLLEQRIDVINFNHIRLSNWR